MAVSGKVYPIAGQQQIPYGNDRKKSKSKDNGKGRCSPARTQQ
jgi:hypothetical protein